MEERSEGPPLVHNCEPVNTNELEQILSLIARQVVSRRLNVPAKLFLEMNKPLTGLLYNLSLVSAPVMFALFGSRLSRTVESILESPENVEQLIRKIEEQEKLQL